MVREGQKRKNRGSSPKIDKSPQLAVLNNLNGSSPFVQIEFSDKNYTFGMVWCSSGSGCSEKWRFFVYPIKSMVVVPRSNLKWLFILRKRGH